MVVCGVWWVVWYVRVNTDDVDITLGVTNHHTLRILGGLEPNTHIKWHTTNVTPHG